MKQNDARNHHYVPEFYLKRWTAKDPVGYLREFSRPHKAFYSRWRPPSGTGFERDLYTVELAPLLPSVALETQFFSKIDDAAARTINKLVEFVDLDETEKSAFTQFVHSLLLRDPETMSVMRKMASESFWMTLDSLQPVYAKRRHEVNGPASLRDFMTGEHTAFLNMTFFTLCHSMMSDDRMGTLIHSLDWNVFEIGTDVPELLTSDRPVICGRSGLTNEQTYVALPISPRVIVIGVRSEILLKNLNKLRSDRFVGLINN